MTVSSSAYINNYTIKHSLFVLFVRQLPVCLDTTDSVESIDSDPLAHESSEMQNGEKGKLNQL